MKLNKKLLSSYEEEYRGFHNALGLYDTMQFVLRLRTDVHQKLKEHNDGIYISQDTDFDVIQAFSTYLHETVHWWQHKGSTIGLILSLSYPIQTHINRKHLIDFINQTGAIKSVKKYNSLYAKEEHPNDKEFQTINQILNNFHDIEFFKSLVILPSEAKNIVNDPLFESVGHSFHIIYSVFNHILMECFDKRNEHFPDLDKWANEFRQLNNEKKLGYYYKSDVYLSPIGLKEIYEGQARFIQMQYLSFASDKKIKWEHFRELGFLSGVYIEAFNIFLSLINSKEPECIDDPLIALFLIICDISINPTAGFPFDIKDFDSFILDNDPGIRFFNICRVVCHKFPELKNSIKNYTASEYYYVSTTICRELGYQTPLECSQKVIDMSNTIPEIISLIKEEEGFLFKNENFPIRLMFSQFLKYQYDKINKPEFFCWAGVFMAGDRVNEEIISLFAEHEALFIDDVDSIIYPRKLPNKNEKNLSETMQLFYTWITSYDMTRQWIMDDGEFSYDYWWLTDKFDKEDMEKWAENAFRNLYDINPKEFDVI